MGKTCCSIESCRNKSKSTEGKSFHRIPAADKLRWLSVLEGHLVTHKKEIVICSDHFTKECFDRTGCTVRLRPNSCPSLFIGQRPSANLSNDEHVKDNMDPLSPKTPMVVDDDIIPQSELVTHDHDYFTNTSITESSNESKPCSSSIQNYLSFFLVDNEDNSDQYFAPPLKILNVFGNADNLEIIAEPQGSGTTNIIQSPSLSETSETNNNQNQNVLNQGENTGSFNIRICTDNLISEDKKKNTLNKFSFLSEPFLFTEGTNEALMLQVHEATISKLSKLQTVLDDSKNLMQMLDYLLKVQKLDDIIRDLNYLDESFVNNHLPHRQTDDDIGFRSPKDEVYAVTLYSASPLLYKYISRQFNLPPETYLQGVFDMFIPTDNGINEDVLNDLKNEVKDMSSRERYCSLMFSEVSINENKIIEGNPYIDYVEKISNNLLVFAVQSLKTEWKRIVAYYFTDIKVSSSNLKILVKELISQLKAIKLNIVTIICNPENKFTEALTDICSDADLKNVPIATIFDAPSLVMHTRDALLECEIHFDSDKASAKFEHVFEVFKLDQQRMFKYLQRLTNECFDWTNPKTKMNAKMATEQLSYRVAALIETYATGRSLLPKESMDTAEFLVKIDSLYTSLNGVDGDDKEENEFAILKESSRHLKFWSEMLLDMSEWKLKDLKTEEDRTDDFYMVQGWFITIQSMICLWEYLKKLGFRSLDMSKVNKNFLDDLLFGLKKWDLYDMNIDESLKLPRNFVEVLRKYNEEMFSLDEDKENFVMKRQ